MQKSNKTVLIAKNISDVFYHVKSVSNIQVLGACTQVEKIEEKSVSIRSIPELKLIEKKERYIDFGPAVTLNEILKFGKNKVPKILYDAILSIANKSIRNIATLGGNICAKGIKHTLWAPLLALNARIELKNQNETKYIYFSNFKEVPKGFIISKIRIPIDEWEIESFKRIGPEGKITENSASFVFLVSTQKDVITNIKIVFAGINVFQSQELENKIIGTRLPLNNKIIDEILKDAKIQYEAIFSEENKNIMLEKQFLNLINYSLYELM